ncbi:MULTISPECIES: hypothetical protein [Bacillus]|uniref:Uncharacterized protein n=1 Tax=Bacillus pseudomycoides TaxID=64104 RepID=A0A1Y3MGG8_9BACI|nr:hypothetical protein [Bacillus pseudomycoides]OUM46273.1 hypothetical protein BW425_24765 [Bacillus pseudomycoides]
MKKLLVVISIFFCVICFGMPNNIKADLPIINQAEEVDKALNGISAYVNVNENSIVSINEREALKDGISQKSIDISKRFFNEQNRLIEAVQAGENLEDIKIDKVLLKEFENYFIMVAKGKTKKQTNLNVMRAIGGCNGDKNKPHLCPPREVKLENISLEVAQKWLLDQGFHRTSSYAGGGKASDPALDFTKCVSANSCVKCAFRDQAVISEDGKGQYKVTIQESEPNPEVLEYVWPSVTWGFYVKWWHDNYC